MSIRDWLTRHRVEDDDSAADPELAALLERARALPNEAEPERDLFAGIANRITATPEPRPVANGWRALFPRPMAAGALAAGLVAVTIFATLQMSGPAGPPSDAEAARIAAMLRERDGVADVHAKVVALLSSHRAKLPPETLAVIEQNLRSIDHAIAEIHLALETHPDEHGLTFLLAEAYRREAQLLERLEFFTNEAPRAEEVRS